MLRKQVFTIFAVFLLLSAPPATATLAADRVPEPADSTVEPGEVPDASSAAYRFTAASLLSIHNNSTQVASAIDNLATTLESYRDPDRIDERVGQTDVATLAVLGRATGTNQKVREQVSKLVVKANRRTARQAIADAGYAIDHSNLSATARDRARSDLADARAALSRGNDSATVSTHDGFRKRLRKRAKAVEQYDLAWQYAQAAIDRVDAATAPSVEITTRYDPLYNDSDSDTPNRTVAGNVTDTQPYELANLSVTTPDRNFTVGLDDATEPGRNATFDFLLENQTRVANVTVTVTDQYETVRSVTPLTLPDKDAFSRGGSGGGSSGGAGGGPIALDPVTIEEYDGYATVLVRGSSDAKAVTADFRAEGSALSGAGVSLASAEFGLASASSTVSVRVSDPRATPPGNLPAVSDATATYLGASVESGADDLESVTYRFEVGDEIGTPTVYQFRNGTWEEVETQSVANGRLTVSVSSVAPLAIAGRATERGDQTATETTATASPATTEGAIADQTTTADRTASQTTAPAPTDDDSGSFLDPVRSFVDWLVEAVTGLVEWAGDTLLFAEGAWPPVGVASGDSTAEFATTDTDSDFESTATSGAVANSATVQFDGDGLSDSYESSVTGTDPRNPDSETAVVGASVGNDSTIDGREDFDADNATNYDEYLHGGSPVDPDSDDDGLEDGTEYGFSKLDALDSDSDDDGVSDPNDDPDNDTLTTRAELGNATSPFDADTDYDTLLDADELANGTDPTAGDPDNDTLLDPVELDLGTDPNRGDTDGDGTIDGNETFTTSADRTVNETNTSVSVTGKGSVASSVTVRDVSEESFVTEYAANASASPVLDFRANRNFTSANITVEYDDAATGNESSLGLYRYNRTLQTYVPVNSSVDADNDTVTGTTSHFSNYVVLNRSSWRAMFNHTMPQSRGSGVIQSSDGFDVTFVIDNSGSMGTNDPDNVRGTAVKEYVGRLNRSLDRAGVVTFESSATLEQPLTHDFAAVNQTAESLYSSGSTYMGAGMRVANNHLGQASNESRESVLVVLSDGKTSDEYEVYDQTAIAANRSYTIHTIGFGSVDEPLMQDVANRTGGTYHYVSNVSNLPGVFSRVVNYTTTAVDADSDGISNAVELGGIPTGTNGVVYTDPEDPDTDNDGLTDGEEIGHPTEIERAVRINGMVQTVSREYYKLVSDPTDRDTDGDGIADAEEFESRTIYAATTKQQVRDVLGATGYSSDVSLAQLRANMTARTVTSDPYYADTDGDGLNDSLETRIGTDPGHSDTDHDDIADGLELGGGSSPTLFDVEPPRITIVQAGWWTKQFSGKSHYEVYYDVRDLAGVDYAKVTKDGDDKARVSYDYARQPYEEPLKFTTGWLGSSIDMMDGATLKVHSEDRHGNARSVYAYSRTNMFGTAAKQLGADSMFASYAAKRLGLLSGFSVGLGQTLGILKLLTNPEELVDMIRQIGYLIDRLGAVWDQLLELIIKGVQQAMRINNPYDEGTHPKLYDTYKLSFYTGYGVFAIVDTFVPGAKYAKWLKKLKYVSKIIRKSPDSVKSAVKLGVRLSDSTGRIPEQLYVKVGGKVSRLLVRRDGFDASTANRFVDDARTVSDQVRTIEQLRRLDADFIDDLPGARQDVVATMFRRHGKTAGDLFTELDPDTRRAMLSMGSQKADAEFADTLVRAYRSEGVDATDVSRVVKRLDSMERHDRLLAIQLLEETGPNGVKQLSGLPAEYYDEVAEFSEVAHTDAYRFVGGMDGQFAPGFWRVSVDGMDDAVWRARFARFVTKDGHFTTADAFRFLEANGEIAGMVQGEFETQIQSIYQTILVQDGQVAANASVKLDAAATVLRGANDSSRTVTNLTLGTDAHSFTVEYANGETDHVRAYHATRQLSAHRLGSLVSSARAAHQSSNQTGNLTVVVNVEQYGTVANQTLESVGRDAAAGLSTPTEVEAIRLVDDDRTVTIPVGTDNETTQSRAEVPVSPGTVSATGE